MKLHSIEVTNACNLKCSYCPNGNEGYDQRKPNWGIVSYPKGLLKLDHYLKALEVFNRTGCVGLSVCGEPLLHPDIVEYVKIAKYYGIRTEIHTNGTLLTEDLFRRIANAGIGKIEVSLHTEGSFEGFKVAYDTNMTMSKPVELVGQVLSCNEEKVLGWTSKESKSYPLLVHATHRWNWAEAHTPIKCRFMKEDLCCMKWDGKIVACCFDFNGDAVIGHIDNFESIKHKQEYKICPTCSPSWATYQNDMWKWIKTEGSRSMKNEDEYLNMIGVRA